MPRAQTLYGSLETSQLEDPDSFVSQLQKILAARRAYDIAASLARSWCRICRASGAAGHGP